MPTHTLPSLPHRSVTRVFTHATQGLVSAETAAARSRSFASSVSRPTTPTSPSPQPFHSPPPLPRLVRASSGPTVTAGAFSEQSITGSVLIHEVRQPPSVARRSFSVDPSLRASAVAASNTAPQSFNGAALLSQPTPTSSIAPPPSPSYSTVVSSRGGIVSQAPITVTHANGLSLTYHKVGKTNIRIGTRAPPAPVFVRSSEMKTQTTAMPSTLPSSTIDIKSIPYSTTSSSTSAFSAPNTPTSGPSMGHGLFTVSTPTNATTAGFSTLNSANTNTINSPELNEPEPPEFTRGQYRVRVSAYGMSKQQLLSLKHLSQRVAVSNISSLFSSNMAFQGLDTDRSCGEDAIMVAEDLNDGIVGLGVADGVGGWAEVGVDPGLMSHRLLQVVRDETRKLSAPRPITALHNAYERIRQDNSVLVGSTTVCLAFFHLHDMTEGRSPIDAEMTEAVPMDSSSSSSSSSTASTPSSSTGSAPSSPPQPTIPSLCTLNLGDSGCIVYRPSAANRKLVYATTELNYEGGAPYQLAVIPPQYKTIGAIENKPNESVEEVFPLTPGDIIIMGSDGLFDNLEPEDVEETVSKVLAKVGERNANRVTATIAKELLARICRDGWKVDDLSVVVARLEEAK